MSIVIQKNIEDVVLFQIDKTNKMAKQHSQRLVDERGMGITVEQWVLLKIVHEESSLTQKELATKSTRDPASITRTLDILGKKNLISREAIPENRRSYNIALTKEGKVFVKKHIGFVQELRENSVKGITKKEMILLVDLLKKMQLNME
jgi:DNA-binding MarR family transcriptional regulator